jgi:hypothetical protein
MNGSGNTGEKKFPDADWADRYRDQDKEPSKKLFEVTDLKCGGPTQDVGTEYEALLRLKPLRTPEQLRRIRTQAQGEKWAIQPVLDTAGLNFDRPPNRFGSEVRSIIQANIWWAVFHFKSKFKRSRPWSESGRLDPLFLRPNRLYPGHPSYPSGHATMAYTWAYLIAKLDGYAKRKQALLDAAAEVALNREIAGVHFGSDSECGRQLGEQIADKIYPSANSSGPIQQYLGSLNP